MRCHEVNYEIIRNSMQVIEVELDPRETVMAEACAMIRMEEGIIFEAKMGDGSDASEDVFGKLFGAGIAAPYPGDIIALDMTKIGEQIVCQKDAFLCAALGTKLYIALNR